MLRRVTLAGTWFRRIALGAAIVANAQPAAGYADEMPTPEGLAYFEKHIRPVLAKQCYQCHSQSVTAKGGLRLDTRDGARLGGSSGPSITPGNPDESILLSALRHEGYEMPPAGKLSDEVIGHFAEWIRMGAPDPRVDTENKLVVRQEIDFDKARQFWAYQPPRSAAPPAVRNQDWVRTRIDQFILARQESAGVRPVGDAAPAVWLRRVTFDLTGLPPTPEEIADFEKDVSQTARERVVDRLLASPRFGERWARHWFDVARYAESTGKERNFVYLQAWRYRDYVIDSLNQDKPYDRFVQEQIAGDLLPSTTDQERNQNLVATGFLALGPKGINERNREAYLLDIVDEQIDSVGRGILATSIGCARCHDHKFDPVPATDYYALAGIFRSTETRAGIINRSRNSNDPALLIALNQPKSSGKVANTDDVAELTKLQQAWTVTRAEVRKLRQANRSTAAEGEEGATAGSDAVGKSGKQNSVAEAQNRLRQLEELIEQVSGRLSTATITTMAIGVSDRPKPVDVALRIRGEVDKLGPQVQRGYLTVVHVKDAPTIPAEQSGRLELAQWLTSRDNPLTARVIVNRIWQKMFGEGIVPTVDDFGEQGQRPTNPQLLDDLAVRFMERGWSIKSLVREIALSHVYQLSADVESSNAAIDGENKLLWRWNQKRLEAEALRDSVLAASGQLDVGRPNTAVLAELGTRELRRQAGLAILDRPSAHRSVYLPILRGHSPKMLALFDMAAPSLIVGQREVTSGPNQALYLMNSPWILEQSEVFARRLLSAPVSKDADRIDLAFEIALGSKPTASEQERALRFLADFAKAVAEQPSKTGAQKSGTADERRLAAWAAFCQTLFAAPEFRYVF